MTKNKLILDEGCNKPEKLDIEDFNKRKEARKLKEDQSSTVDVTENQTINALISTLIQDRWEAIDMLNGSIASLQEFERPDITAVLGDIISDEYVHIGQLEKVLELVNTAVTNIEVGKENIEDNVRATDDLPDAEVEEESLEESNCELPADDIDESLAQSIDFKQKETTK